ncbi:uncharacterized protein LOC111624409 [Centruroides sculpturatus]|uniref:uncharacterized protein LOC111624409 n=1 Tax=Centruroides sculpturatus TaxID=218467 RepID=UPI000C6ED8FB|nr:uncharacterized protein LOC111624409 [Centruroides sculpturatus]
MAVSRFDAITMSGCALVFLSAVVVIIAFATPYWLVSDGQLPVEHFEKLGLWEACFKSFSDPNFRFDKEYRGCMWILDEDYTVIYDILEKPFFIAVQVLYTLGFIAVLGECLGFLGYIFCVPSEKAVTALVLLSVLAFSAGILHTIAVIVFGALGDGRDWMPDPDNNYLSWSFGLAAIGAILQLIAAVLFLLESVITRRRLAKEQQQLYAMGQMPSKTNHQ